MTLREKDKTSDFEEWARLLICRKLPDAYQHLINSEVVHDGAAILQRGDAFEVRISDQQAHQQVLVTPFPPTILPPASFKTRLRA
ncbi:MAG TPA: hypothetical protein VKV04_00275 [Verrucomicrobiae bacterium]|nr:hypothetical protein [Verrucomicrobiae bacterium]